MSQARLADDLIAWQRRCGRQELPWQGTHDPYRIWVSEIMLQQTQVSTVIERYRVFMTRFPSVEQLAAASLEAVLGCWSGLGYYSRARNLHAAARLIMTDHAGRFPTSARDLQQLPGIGRSTAAAIAVFAGSDIAAILDGNVKRVLARVFAIDGWPGQAAVERQLWDRAEAELPRDSGKEPLQRYTQGLMDLGATVCLPRKPRCEGCPLADRCQARATGREAALPAPRPARVVPLRIADWALIRHGDRVLMQERPSRGLWGGLWALPEIRPPHSPEQPQVLLSGCDVIDWIEAHQSWLNAQDLSADPQPLDSTVRHVFTHFRLEARVWSIEVPAPWVFGDHPPGLRWLELHPTAIETAPLPTPVRRLLQGPPSLLRERPAG